MADVDPAAVRALLAHLREGKSGSPKVLAERFGLPQPFVADMLAIETPDMAVRMRRLGRGAVGRSRTAGWRLLKALLRLTRDRNGLVFGAWSFVAIASPASLLLRLSPTTPVALGAVVAALQTWTAHRRARSSLAWRGAAGLFAALIAVYVFHQFDGTPRARTLGAETALLVFAFLAGGYGGLLHAVAGLGAARDRRRRRERLDRMDRAALVARYFELDRRLDREPPPPVAAPRLVAFAARRPYVAALTGALGGEAILRLASLRPELTPLAFPGLALEIGTGVLLGLAAPSFRRAVLPALAGAAAPWVLEFRPGGNGVGAEDLASVPVFLALAALGRGGARLGEAAARESRLRGGDRAMVAAEMARIARRLSDRAGEACVLVVDVVGSTVMKAGEDPLAIEATFGAYQAWVARIARDRGGRVLATAGDGAVVALPTPAAAFATAREIQEGVDEFARRHHRLARPFRLRVGLHRGEVHGDLGEVRYTAVIDVAAHVQDAAPVGGVALTAAVAEALDAEDLAPASPVDGHAVLTWVPEAV